MLHTAVKYKNWKELHVWQIREMSNYVALFMMDNHKFLWFNLLLKFCLSYRPHTLQYYIIGNIIWYWYSISKRQFHTNIYLINRENLKLAVWGDKESIINVWLISPLFVYFWKLFLYTIWAAWENFSRINVDC